VAIFGYPPIVGIGIHSFTPDEAEESDAQVIGQLHAEVGGCRFRDDDGHISASYFEQDFRGNAAAGDNYTVIGRYIFQETLAKDFVNGIVPTDVLAKDEEALGITQGGAMDTTGSPEDFGTVLELSHPG
jgi:hypothetical protein